MTRCKFVDRRAFSCILLPIATFFSVAIWQQSSLAEPPRSGKMDATNQAESLSQAFRHAAATAVPTVVKIETMATARQRKGRSRFDPGMAPKRVDEFSSKMFPDSPLTHEGVGSGVIIDRSGIILTSSHVVADAAHVIVKLSDGRAFRATDIKTDPSTDLAIVRISTHGNLPEARLGNSDTLQVGDWVIGIGHPFGLETTVSAGIISAKDCAVPDFERARFLQTDAALNPGNSGGPLVNLRGQVVGINSNLISRTSGGSNGIAFAVPITLAKWVAKELIQNGKVRRSHLGVEVDPLSPELAEQLGVARVVHGLVVSNVYPHTPAARAGFQIADIITHFDNTPVHSPWQLRETSERGPVGSQKIVKILRDGQPTTLKTQLTALPNEFGTTDGAKQSAYVDERLGLILRNVTPKIAHHLGYFNNDKGVLVSAVDPYGIAYEKELHEEMLILRVGKKVVRNVSEYKAAMQGQSLKKGILLLIHTPNGSHFAVLKR